jgi:hydrogenase maturation protease
MEVVVLACGDPLRGDDAAGPAAVRRLPPHLPRTTVHLVGALGVDDLVALPPGTGVVIVDAVVGPPVGEVVDLTVAELVAESGHRRSPAAASSHQLSLADVVALAQVLRASPLEGRFVGLAIESVAIGTGLSTRVGAALPAFVAAIERAIRDLAGDPGTVPAPGRPPTPQPSRA